MCLGGRESVQIAFSAEMTVEGWQVRGGHKWWREKWTESTADTRLTGVLPSLTLTTVHPRCCRGNTLNEKKSQSWWKEMLLWMLILFERKHQCFAGCHWELNLTLWSLLIYFWEKGWGKSAVRQWHQPLSHRFPCPLSYLDALLVKTERKAWCLFSVFPVKWNQ